MRIKNLIILMFNGLMILVLAGCMNMQEEKRESLYDDAVIVEEVDDYTYSNKMRRVLNNEAKIGFSSFTGVDLVMNITTIRNQEIEIDYLSKITSGDFGIVLILPDNEVVTILNGSQEGTGTFSIKKGLNRIKILGKESTGDIRIKVSGDNLRIKGM